MARMVLAGLADPEATRARVEGAGAAPGWARALGGTGLTVSALGFGTYRIDGRPEHAKALAAAVAGGVNLFDTASHYGGGASEEALGEVFADLGQGARGGLVVVGKAGTLQGPLLEEVRRGYRPGRWDLLQLQHAHWHTLDPALILRAAEVSRQRMGVAAHDVLLLHNPEKMLDPALPAAERRSKLDAAMRQCFAALEECCAAGRLGAYGVSSNTLAADPARSGDALDLARVLAAARGAGGASHRLRVVELPLNPCETEGLAVVERACAEGLAVLTNRPLNALVEGRLVRLAAPPEPSPAPAQTFRSARAAVAALERQAQDALAPELGRSALRQATWSEELARLASQAGSALAMQAALAERVVPGLRALAERAGTSRQGSRWAAAYREAVLVLARVAWRDLAARDTDHLQALAADFSADLPEPARSGTLAQQALSWSLAQPGVSAVLHGMRQPRWVAEALALGARRG